MLFNAHYNLAGKHAFLSPSTYHWINYDLEKLDLRYSTHMTAVLGTRLHEYAHMAIQLGVKQRVRPKTTLSMYINDAIGFRMKTEQVLWYSDNCFGTTDAISFRQNLLRIHDLKNGASIASMNQLKVYAALFCLEYDERPGDIEIELRIYQDNDVLIERPEPVDILRIMDTIIRFDKRIEELKALSGVDD